MRGASSHGFAILTIVTDRRRATCQDVLDAPEHVVAEIVNGELHLSPRAGEEPAAHTG